MPDGVHALNLDLWGEGSGYDRLSASMPPVRFLLALLSASCKCAVGRCATPFTQQRAKANFRKNWFTSIRHFTGDGVRETAFKRPGSGSHVEKIKARNAAAVIIKEQSCIGAMLSKPAF